MDVFPLAEFERDEAVWQKVEMYVKQTREKWVQKLVAKESEEVRGRIKALDQFLVDAAGIQPTAD